MAHLSLYRFVIAATLGAAMFGGAQNPAPAAPAQFPPLGTGVTAEDARTLQTAVHALQSKIVALKQQYRSSPLFDHIADVEVILDAVRRPLKYDERLYAG